ncbi:MAG: hypothetical protein ABJE95_23570 [Byssovorax sp.]
MLKRPFRSRRAALLGAACVAATAFVGPSCATVTPTGTGGTGGGGGSPTMLSPGEVCTPPKASDVRLRIEPATVFVPTCAAGAVCVTRPVRVTADPDLCPSMNTKDAADLDVPVPAAITVTTLDGDVVPAPAGGSVGLHEPTLTLSVKGGTKAGTTTLLAHLPTTPKGSDGARTKSEITLPFTVTTLDATPITCAGAADDVPLTLLAPDVAPVLQGSAYTSGDRRILAKGKLAGASIGLQERADAPNANSFLWHVDPFKASIACSVDLTPPGYVALGPAITFGPETKLFNREIPFSVPINPALLPEKAFLRHVRVVYSGPAFKKPRTITVADPRIEKIGGAWAFQFKAPRLGTYQVVVAKDAGTVTRKRRITHRAVIGISMGGGGTATFGMRHHDKFDVLAPLGGPVSWTWMLDYIDQNHLGGFRSIPKGTTLASIPQAAVTCVTGAECKADETCIGVLPMLPGKCTLMPKAVDPYLHPQAFNNWWYEYPRTGNGGTFSRVDYAQIFRDLALMYGNPNGENLSPGAENLPAGVNPNDKSVTGDHPNHECQVWVDPIDPGPDATPAQMAEYAKQNEINDSCPKERCAHTLTLNKYYDDEYNPDGAFPVISVCDSSPQNQALTPYANTWTPTGAAPYPLEVGLAVDYNGNGVRDELEPIIRAGHEPWGDFGVDGLPSAQEPGYQVGINEDPAGDDYNAQYNPTGTEGNHRFDVGEKYDDVGLDGVAGTPQQPATGYEKAGDGYDVGEGDSKFTVSRGLQRFWDRDAYSIARKMVDPQQVPGGDLTDEALSRIDMWTDGGTRDLFNFSVDAQHLVGGFSARGRDVVYLTEPSEIAGLAGQVPSVPTDPNSPKVAADYIPSHVNYQDLQGVVFQRYGKIDPTPKDIEDGSGQHVGTAPELIKRIQSALYFIGSRWREPDLVKLNSASSDNPIPGLDDCEVVGTCTINFTSKAGRTGPVGITLPPGYANADLKNVRYPIIYMLHGYGQGPADLEAAIVLFGNWMNSSLDSSASRLPKAIVVYVDGRCRIANGKPECIRGTFFADSARADGAQDEQWWLELMDYMDQHYRTLGETTVDWTE